VSVRREYAVCPHDCYDTCGLHVTVDNGAIRAVRGAREHPLTRGFVCLKVSRYPERIAHPDRVLSPLRRVGPKGSGRFVETTWDEALGAIGARLQEIVATWGGEAVLPYSFAGNMGVLAYGSLDQRFFHALGASRLERTICTAAADAATRWVFGMRLGPDPEVLPEARLILLWGANPAVTNVHAIPLLDAARARGAEIWTIDPLRTETARRYDRHLAIWPGTDAVLALGLVRWLVRTGRYDRAFVERYAEGLEDLLAVAEPWTLERTADATGLAVDAVHELAERVATVRPLLIRAGYGVQRQDAGGAAYWALAALSVVAGAPADVGGGFLGSNRDAFVLNHVRLTAPDLLKRPVRRVNMIQLGDALLRLDNPPVKALVVYNANPAATAPDQRAVLQGLAREDLLVVVHEQMLTDTAQWADWVLPAALAFETLDLHTSYWHRYLQLSRPVRPPAGDAVSNTEFFRRLAKAVGLTEPRLFASDEELIRDALDTDHPWMRGITLERLYAEPIQRVRLDPRMRPFVDTPIPTPSGRIRLKPPPWMKPVLPPSRDDGRLWLISPAKRETIKSSFGNIESLRRHEPEPTLLLAPPDAERLGLTDGMLVSVENEQGAARFRLVVCDVPRPGTAVSYAVHWNRDGDGANVNQLTSQRTADAGGGATFYAAKVAVRAVTAPKSPSRITEPV
jgi:anaerobic selenocysteine-containing dehydrogenase